MMNRAEFRDLLRRYLDDACTPQEAQLVEQLYDLIGDARTPLEWSDAEHLEAEMWAKIEAETGVQAQEIVITKKYNSLNIKYLAWIGRVAAAVVFVCLVGWWWQQSYPKTHGTYKEIVNKTNKVMQIKTEEGSKIALQPDSRLRYPEHFEATKREIYLEGVAFIDVVPNPEKPFLVHTGDVVTKVLGTSFWVRNAEGGKNVEVEVKSGRVSVFNKKLVNAERKELGTEGVVLTPNQKVQYIAKNEVFVTGLVAQPQVLETVIKKELIQFDFDDTPLSEVVSRLELAYGIKIVLSSDLLNNCPLTANLMQQPLFEKLALICGSLNATFEIKGTTILISGRGCL